MLSKNAQACCMAPDRFHGVQELYRGTHLKYSMHPCKTLMPGLSCRGQASRCLAGKTAKQSS